MADLNVNLNSIKASGVYTFEVDKTLTLQETFSQNRLIVGFSRKGVFNRPVVINSVQERLEIFGEIDTFLERRGSYFHRSIDVALEQGPVIALNLLPLDNSTEGDKVDYQSLSLSQSTKNSSKLKYLYSSFYDKEKFWKPSTMNYKSIVDTFTPSKLLSFTNLSQDKYTVLIKKSPASKTSIFNILVQDFYGKNDVPSYLNGFDYLSDYFVDVYIIKGNFTDYNTLSKDPVYSKYFTTSGLKKNQLTALLASSDFQVVGNFFGTIIPNFFDGQGVGYSVDSIINRYTSKLGLFCFLDSDLIESTEKYDVSLLDLIGHTLVQEDSTVEDLDYLSYKIKLLENNIYTKKTTFTKTGVNASIGSLGIRTTLGTGSAGLFENSVLVQGTEVQANLIAGTSLIELESYERYAKIKSFATSSGNTLISYTNPMKSYEGSFRYSVLSANATANSILVSGIHTDLSYGMTGKDVLLHNDLNKFYYNIASYSTHTGNSTTTLIFTTNDDLVYVDETYKSQWSAGYDVLSVNVTANTITIAGKHDFSNIYSSLSSNVLYLKTNADKDGNVKFTTHSFDANNNTVLSLSSGNVKISNGATVNIISTNSLTELTSTKYYVTYGAYGIQRAKISSSNVNLVNSPDQLVVTGNTISGYAKSTLYKDVETGNLTVGDFYYKETSPSVVVKHYTTYEKTKDVDDIDLIKVKIYTDSDLTAEATTSVSFGNKEKNGSGFTDLASNELGIVSKIGNINNSIEIVETYDGGTRIRLTSTNAGFVNIGDYVNSYVIEDGVYVYFLSKVYSKKKVIVGTVVYYDIYIPRAVKLINVDSVYHIEIYKPIEDFITDYNLFGLDGFKMKEYHIPGNQLNSQTQLEKILGVIEDTGLYNALADINIIDYRYIVDTFDTNVFSGYVPKDVLVRLAKKQGKSIAFINSPKISTLVQANTPGPVFTDYDSTLTVKKVFKPEYLASGGNLDLSPNFLFNLPDEENGSKYGAVVGPYFNYQLSNGSMMLFPPAVVASNLFVRKLQNGDEFKIAAGTDRGLVTTPNIISLEYEYSDVDRNFLEPAGYNAFIFKRGYGIMLYGNQTMYQKFKSALNNLHVRDMLITIERGIEQILNRYVFEQNTPNTRLSVADDVTSYLKTVVIAEGIYNFDVRIDNTNNTNETIDANFGIIDVAVEPVMGMQKFVNVLTVLKTQGVNASGFGI